MLSHDSAGYAIDFWCVILKYCPFFKLISLLCIYVRFLFLGECDFQHLIKKCIEVLTNSAQWSTYTLLFLF